MNPIADLIDAVGLTGVWTYVLLFLGASWLVIWRLEALMKHGLDGTALGTLVMPYCSGLGNLLFVAIVSSGTAPVQEVLTNCIVNNVTNLTLLLGLPALIWGVSLREEPATARKASARVRAAEVAHRLSRLSLLLTLTAVLFFGGAAWALAEDGLLDRQDGVVLVGLFLFWQCFHVFDVSKHNIRQKRSFGVLFYLDLLLAAVGAYALYVSIDWLVTWISAQPSGFIRATNLGWISGWLMVLPNALLAGYYAAKRRGDIVYASQVGDGHICIPLCIGLAAVIQPVTAPTFFATGLAIMMGAAVVHILCIALVGSLPRWMGWPLMFAYGWFLSASLFDSGP